MLQEPVEALLRRVAGEARNAQRAGVSVRDKARGGPVDLVTEADLRADAALRAGLEALAPGVPIVSEERDQAAPPADCFVVDPIDGTHNFAAGLPLWSISVARMEGGEAVEAWIWDETVGAALRARRGDVARRDGVPVRLSDAPTRHALLSVGLHPRTVPLLLAAERFSGVRVFGSYACSLAAVADGRVALHAGRGRVWDVAAGWLLVQAGGGIVCGFDGRPVRPWDEPWALAGTTAAVEQALAVFDERP